MVRLKGREIKIVQKVAYRGSLLCEVNKKVNTTYPIIEILYTCGFMSMTVKGAAVE